MAKQKQPTKPTPKYWQGKEDGHWYGYIRIPCEAAKEDIERWILQYGCYHLEYKDWVKNGGLVKADYGSKSGRKIRLEKRDELISQTYSEGLANGLSKEDIYEKVNAALRKWGFKKLEDKELSDERIRKIVSVKKHGQKLSLKRKRKIKKMLQASSAFSYDGDYGELFKE